MRDLIIDVALFALCVTVITALMAWGATWRAQSANRHAGLLRGCLSRLRAVARLYGGPVSGTGKAFYPAPGGKSENR